MKALTKNTAIIRTLVLSVVMFATTLIALTPLAAI